MKITRCWLDKQNSLRTGRQPLLKLEYKKVQDWWLVSTSGIALLYVQTQEELLALLKGLQFQVKGN